MWLTHLEFDATNPFMRHWFDAMGERGRDVRYDTRGCGLSEPAPAEISFDRWVDDLEAVAASVSDDPVNVLGFSQGAAVAIGFAVRRRPPSSPAVATGAHLMTTPSTSPWPSWPGRRSGTPPSRGRPPRSSLTCQRPARRSCRRSPTSSAFANIARNNRAPTGCPRLRCRPCGPALAGGDVAHR
jgi:pimeloyl-ACP methyl ester carboxylesterase